MGSMAQDRRFEESLQKVKTKIYSLESDIFLSFHSSSCGMPIRIQTYHKLI